MKKIPRPYTYNDLVDLYINKNMDQREIAELFNVNRSLVGKDLKAMGIIKTEEAKKECFDKKFKASIEKTQLEYLYIEKNYSQEELAQLFNVNERTIRRYLKEYEIQKSFELQQEKALQSNLERYGVPYFSLSDKAKNQRSQMVEKMRSTNLKKYGVANSAQNKQVVEKMRQTVREKYGVESVAHLPEVQKKKSKRYAYDGLFFDSSWELALWIYAKDHNQYIEREPCKFLYIYNNQEYCYFPDFKYEDVILEIKGDWCLENDSLINPFDRSQDGKSAAKLECMKEHGVVLWTRADVEFALVYVNQTYGLHYLQKFRNL